MKEEKEGHTYFRFRRKQKYDNNCNHYFYRLRLMIRQKGNKPDGTFGYLNPDGTLLHEIHFHIGFNDNWRVYPDDLPDDYLKQEEYSLECHLASTQS